MREKRVGTILNPEEINHVPQSPLPVIIRVAGSVGAAPPISLVKEIQPMKRKRRKPLTKKEKAFAKIETKLRKMYALDANGDPKPGTAIDTYVVCDHDPGYLCEHRLEHLIKFWQLYIDSPFLSRFAVYIINKHYD